jgi:hypothetical protein
MPTFNSTVRLRGALLDASDTYIDCAVGPYSLSGHIRLTEDVSTNPREWTVEAADLRKWEQNNTAAPVAVLTDPDGDVWSVISDLEAAANNAAVAPGQGEIQSLADELFKTAIRAQRQS